jgi:uncharacterized protein (DUF305 family)
MTVIALVSGLAITVAGVALAQSGSHGGMSGGKHHEMHQQMHKGMHNHESGDRHGRTDEHAVRDPRHGELANRSASSLAFDAVGKKMHAEMSISYSGDADRDFLRAMIPHHQGAVDMARIVIAFGKDPDVRKLAEEIVRAQESEIAFMRAKLEKQ